MTKTEALKERQQRRRRRIRKEDDGESLNKVRIRPNCLPRDRKFYIYSNYCFLEIILALHYIIFTAKIFRLK